MAQAQKKPATSAKTATKKKKKKKKKGYGRIILTVLMVLVILAASAFIYYLGKTVYTNYVRGEDEGGTVEVNPITYETTPVAQSEKVGYYLVGLMGEDGLSDDLQMLSLLCFDKVNKEMHILQIPRDTYLGTDGTFKVKKAGQVYANPQDYDWCDTCRKRVFAPEIAEDGTHSVCGRELVKKEGSATVNLVEIVNQQYGLPVDGYYIFEQKTLLKLVDLVGGINVDLSVDVTVEDTTYQKGVRIIDGAAALKYITSAKDTVDGDIARFDRFQQVFTALMQRLFVMDGDKLTADVFQPLMMGSTPIRVAVDDGYAKIVKLVQSLSGVPFDKMTAYVIPGEVTTSEGVTYYSVHRQELLALLNASFNPVGDPLGEGDMGAVELAAGGQTDLRETRLSQWMVEQNTVITTTGEETTEATAAS